MLAPDARFFAPVTCALPRRGGSVNYHLRPQPSQECCEKGKRVCDSKNAFTTIPLDVKTAPLPLMLSSESPRQRRAPILHFPCPCPCPCPNKESTNADELLRPRTSGCPQPHDNLNPDSTHEESGCPFGHGHGQGHGQGVKYHRPWDACDPK